VAFEDARVTVAGTGQVVPVAVWYPTVVADPLVEKDPSLRPTPAAAATYPHAISVAKIARVLLNAPASTPRVLDRDVPLAMAPGVAPSSSATPPSDAVRGAVVLCHGYLGSRFDLVDLAEALAASGFLVAAPEFAESLASPETVSAQTKPGAKPAANPSASRDQVLAAVLEDVERRARLYYSGNTTQKTNAVPPLPVALVGQSAGASTATSARGRFAARVAIAGFRPPPSEARAARAASSTAMDPLLVVASAGDGVISLYPTERGAFGPYRGIEAEVAAFEEAEGVAFARLDAEGLLESVARRRAGGGEHEVPRAAFVTYEDEYKGGRGVGLGGPEDAAALARDSANSGAAAALARPLPCHISFLSSRTNDAMVEVLSPLLPAARALGVPVLDFDRYQVARDSDDVNETLVPAVVAWLAAVVR
jgi:dienelactone hydrolase